MYKNAADDQRSKKIRCILRDKKQSVEKISKQEQKDHASHDPQFLTYDRKDHIVLRFRNTSELLDTVSKATSQESAGTDRIKSLYGLICRISRRILRMEPCYDSIQTEVICLLYTLANDEHANSNNSNRHCRNNKKNPRLWMCYKDHSRRDAENNDSRT